MRKEGRIWDEGRGKDMVEARGTRGERRLWDEGREKIMAGVGG